MTVTAGKLLETTTGALAPDPAANPFVPLVERGEAALEALARLALEQRWVIPADRRAFQYLAERAEPAAAACFTSLATGEELAATHLDAFARACGVTPERSRAYVPLPGCQAYPAYVSWLALNAAPADVVLALTANFSAWGGYCDRLAKGLRTHYGFEDEACAFFDFFAAPAPRLDQQATAAVQAGLDGGALDTDLAHTYGTLLQSYESMFWATLG
ncbi:transcriptional regulator [Streptomyces sp. MMG1121]|uniref:transcriptional regulator n=1 Tax=Streptomyces sp. MMG1121 TaxID=1415544 RepID=UPI0006ADA97A|nr:transcriptional regulator [Streptomyces sp. MMG1121]KOV57135.1 transcriptional regulator [Streptomyces sp. MMG1121]